jgi:4,5-DOPA dioxygenase extradiol
MTRLPALFVGHGSPLNAIETNAWHRGWREAAARLPKPKAVLCVSAHWETKGVWVTATPWPETIHDFSGFPPALFAVRYPAPGDPALARRVAELLDPQGVGQDEARGLDHGAWGVLLAMYPDAEVPVVQLSLDTGEPGAFHFRLARRLLPLRDEGVLVLGSGNVVHNLRRFDWSESRPLHWAQRFDAEVKTRIRARDHAALLDPHALSPDGEIAVPTPEHYLPLLYVLALQAPDEPVSFFNEDVVSSISMTSVVVGEAGGGPQE